MINTRDKWIESARLYIHDESEYCDCDCWLCMRDEHDEHCEGTIVFEDEILSN
jgi:hypothetical protein